MSRSARTSTLGEVARAGFQALSTARSQLLLLAERLELPHQQLLEAFSVAADPDAALLRVMELQERHGEVLLGLDQTGWKRVALLFGASPALADFFVRHPQRLRLIIERGGRLIGAGEARSELLSAVNADEPGEVSAQRHDGDTHKLPVAKQHAEAGAAALRVRYRELLAEVVLFDLSSARSGNGLDVLEAVTASLSDLADAALEAGLAVARGTLLAGVTGAPVTYERMAMTRLAVVAMGKCGARELNVVSDVDVIYVMASDASTEQTDEALRIATRLASESMRAIHAPGVEPPLWEVDANLRPEGKHGPLVRTLNSMINYYERWAKTWEFQALLKARVAAGDRAVGEEFVELTRPMVWSSSNRDDFVGSVQRMRERVQEQIEPNQLDAQIKLGPGGLRDVEFSVQLLQLVHGQYDESLHLAGTLPALEALAAGGYVARGDSERLAAAYRLLRLLEHRLQLRDLRRTATMPQDEEGLRLLARATGFGISAEQLSERWRTTRTTVRELHLKIFYAPLLNAVASLPEGEIALGTEAARARLHSIGFLDPDGAMRHLAALTQGSSRAARIQRNLLPVLLQWFAEGTDPDYGLLAFRRVSEANRDTPWYLRLLRDGTDAAERLARVLSSSRFAAELLESIPEAVAWLERDAQLRPVSLQVLLEEMRALASRRATIDEAATALRAVHRREVLRLALGRLVSVIGDAQVAFGLDAAHTALLDGLLLALRTPAAAAEGEGSTLESQGDGVELSLIGMGRFGGRELGFASDIDLLVIYRDSAGLGASAAPGHAGIEAQQGTSRRQAEHLIAELRRLVADPRFAVDLDFDLRPEGKNGPIVRSLDAYRAYYERWSLTWEAQALLRARAVAGDESLGDDFITLANQIRYPHEFGEHEMREVRRMKARVEAERLPRGVDPARHLKLGPGGISDVEWLVQLLQLRFAQDHEALQTESTLEALDAAVRIGVLDASDRVILEASWLLASRIRTAAKLWSGRVTDALPTNRSELEGIAGLLGLPKGQTTQLEERWFAASRRARAVFEREFFGYDGSPRTLA